LDNRRIPATSATVRNLPAWRLLASGVTPPGADSADLDSSFMYATLNPHHVRAGFPSGVVGTEVRIVANDAVGTADT
jgi:hypothetical protein